MLKLLLITCLLLVGCDDDDGGHYQYAGTPSHPKTDNESVTTPVTPAPTLITPVTPTSPDIARIPEPSNRNALLIFGGCMAIGIAVGRKG